MQAARPQQPIKNLEFGMAGPKPAAPVAAKFNYDGFYEAELDKKHKDKSYRYFNNINRLAQEFPRAHMASKEDKVTVWCSNDYVSPIYLSLRTRRLTSTARGLAGRETFLDTISTPSVSNPVLQTCTPRKPPLSSPLAMLPMMLRSPRLEANCPTVSFSPTA